MRYTISGILFLASLVSLWFLLNNLQSLGPALYAATIFSLISVFLLLKLSIPGCLKATWRLLTSVSNRKYFIPIAATCIVVVSTLTRLYFYYKFTYTPTSDPMSYYETAQKIASGQGIMGDSYIAFFPHLAAYDITLGVFMKAISEPWLATIALNIVFDLGSATILYLLVSRLTKRKSKVPLLAATIWLLSPSNILFSTLSLPVVIVNFFIIASIFVVYLLTKKVTEGKVAGSIILSVVLGLVIGCGNNFRPIFPIAIIAIFMLFAYIIVRNRRSARLYLLTGVSLAMMTVTFFGYQKISLDYISAQIGKEASSSGGWNIYVGSNSETDGTWNRLDELRMQTIICKDKPAIKDCQESLQQAGIDRYKAQGLEGTLNLFIRKLYVFSSEQAIPHNVNAAIDGYVDSDMEKKMNIYSSLFYAALFYFSAHFLYSAAKRAKEGQQIPHAIIFTAILMLGFFSSSAIVETAPRYAQIMYPAFTLFAALAFTIPINRRNARTSNK